MGFEVKGLEEWKSKSLKLISESFPKEKEKELKAISNIAKSEIQLVTSVETGTLRRSIDYEIVDKNTSVVGTDVSYAKAVNDGHRTHNDGFVKGQHFMEKGLQNAESKIYGHLDKWLSETIEKAGD